MLLSLVPKPRIRVGTLLSLVPRPRIRVGTLLSLVPRPCIRGSKVLNLMRGLGTRLVQGYFAGSWGDCWLIRWLDFKKYYVV